METIVSEHHQMWKSNHTSGQQIQITGQQLYLLELGIKLIRDIFITSHLDIGAGTESFQCTTVQVVSCDSIRV